MARINILSRDEAKQDDMRQRLGDARVRFFVGDVRDYDSVADAVVGADFVFHAAALKQVPSCEFFPDQAVKTNVIGSHNVVEAAHRSGRRARSSASAPTRPSTRSTPWACRKALMEKTAQAFARNNPDSPTTVSVTRYGNVMYSRGSVIPLFVRQLAAGPAADRHRADDDPLPDVAPGVGRPGRARVPARRAGRPVRQEGAGLHRRDAARAVARVLGYGEPEVRSIGMRHGEKMYETLLAARSSSRPTDQGDYFRVPLDARALDYELYVDRGERGGAEATDYDSTTTQQLTVEETEELLLTLPEIQAPRRRGGRAREGRPHRRGRLPRLAHAPAPARPGRARGGRP